MIMNWHRAKVLYELCPCLIHGRSRLKILRGPRGGVVSYRAKRLPVSRFLRDVMLRDGLINRQGWATKRGAEELQSWLATHGPETA